MNSFEAGFRARMLERGISPDTADEFLKQAYWADTAKDIGGGLAQMGAEMTGVPAAWRAATTDLPRAAGFLSEGEFGNAAKSMGSVLGGGALFLTGMLPYSPFRRVSKFLELLGKGRGKLQTGRGKGLISMADKLRGLEGYRPAAAEGMKWYKPDYWKTRFQDPKWRAKASFGAPAYFGGLAAAPILAHIDPALPSPKFTTSELDSMIRREAGKFRTGYRLGMNQ